MPRLSVHTEPVREGGESDEDMPDLVYVSEHWAGHYDYPILPDIEAEPLALRRRLHSLMTRTVL